MKTRLHTLLLLLGCFTYLAATAAPLTPQQALDRAIGSSNRPLKVRGPSLNLTTLVKTVNMDDEPALYVFNGPEAGFLVASADDRVPATLAYSNTNTFDPDNIPPAMQWQLEQYAAEIKYAITNGITIAPRNSVLGPEIPHLVKTTWNQGAPYNDLCPLIGSERTVTGCVATAMAQVINYHKVPAAKGIGTHSYTWNSQTLTFDYGGNSFDWANMLDAYPTSTSGTSAERAAVAKLMLACGVSVNMNYNVASTGGSGAASARITAALTDYFGFDLGAQYMMADYFSADQWDRMIYNELAAGRPVLLGGQGTAGGHEFLCDGYDGEGKFHINWGWEGTSDGFFLLTALDPSALGTGGGAGGFNSNRDAVIGIQPPQEGSSVDLSVYATGPFAYSTSYGFYFENGAFFSFHTGTHEVTPGVHLVSNANAEYYWASPDKITFAMNDNGQIHVSAGNYRVETTEIPAGTYMAYPVYRENEQDQWHEIHVPASSNQYVTVRVGDNGVVTYDGSDPDQVTSNLSAEISIPSDQFKQGQVMHVDTKLTNNGPVADYQVGFKFVNQDTGVSSMMNGYYPFSKLSTGEHTYQLSVAVPETLADGSYELYATDRNQNHLNISNAVGMHVGTITIARGIEAEEPEIVDVYSMTGILVKSQVPSSEATDGLPAGIYVAGGKKYLVK